MAKRRTDPEDVRRFIIKNVGEHSRDIGRLATDHFGFTRSTAVSHLKKLVDSGDLRAKGRTRAREYTLTTLVNQLAQLAVTPRLEEHVAWQESISPYLKNVRENVLAICQYGFTEMVNNVVSHSSAKDVEMYVSKTAARITLTVSDNGVGIFHKIQQDLGFKDPRDALLELSKGKLTSDPKRHTGEGIFFTSRMFDEFSIRSGELFYWRRFKEDDWLFEVEDADRFSGTRILMEIDLESQRTSKQVFDQHSTGKDDYSFSRTHVPVALARYPREQLLSRSQARRVLARFDRFSEVLLDFQGVESIGQAFADEIFRVYANEHPETHIIAVRAVPEVDLMIKRAAGTVTEPEPASKPLRLF